MKKKLKSINQYVIVFLLGGLILGSIGVYATSLLSSSEVSYDNSKSGGNSNNVQGALEELYEKSSKCTTGSCSLTESNFYVGYTYNQEKSASNYCVTGDEATCKRTDCYTSSAKTCPSGTIIDYIVSGTNTRVRFHVMYDKGRKLTMQSQKNIVNNIPWANKSDYIAAGGSVSAWGNVGNNNMGPVTILPTLESTTSSWSNVENQTYTLGETVFKDNAYTGCSVLECSTNRYTWGKRTARVRMITLQETVDLGCTRVHGSCPLWLYNQFYWLVSADSIYSSGAEVMSNAGRIYYDTNLAATDYGARAVIEVSK